MLQQGPLVLTNCALNSYNKPIHVPCAFYRFTDKCPVHVIKAATLGNTHEEKVSYLREGMWKNFARVFFPCCSQISVFAGT